MGHQIHGTHSVGAIQHPRQESKPVTGISRLVLPVSPYGEVAGIRLAVDVRHDGAYKDGDEDASDNGEASNHLDRRQRSVEVEDDEDGDPGDDDVGDEHVPLFGLEAVMHDGVHGDGLGGDNLHDGGETEQPCESVPPASKPAASSSISSASDCSPMVYCSKLSIGRNGAVSLGVSIPPPAEGIDDANSAIEAAMIQ